MTDDKESKTINRVFEFFDEGKRFTEELLSENERLRLLNAQLKSEKRDVENRQHVRVDVQMLEEELIALRQENKELRAQFASVEDENREFADRYITVERQNSDLVNLYVASYRLHSTLDYPGVVQIIKEIVINMIGSELFGIYVCDEQKNRLVLIGHEGLDDPSAEVVPIDEGVIGQVAQSGKQHADVDRADTHQKGQEPIVCIPLKIGEQVLGVIAIFGLLVQKDNLKPVDFELFELLGGHAATALYVSRLYGASERKRNTLEGFIDLLKHSPKDETQ